MHLKSLHIKNFRTLEDFQVSKLGRVNLIVGKNNSGKSSVLEALRIYAGNANLQLLRSIAFEHDEAWFPANKDSQFEEVVLPMESLFYGRIFPSCETQFIEIGGIGESSNIQIKHEFLVVIPNDIQDDEYGVIYKTLRYEKIPKDELSHSEIVSGYQNIIVYENNKMLERYPIDDMLNGNRGPISLTKNRLSCSYVSTSFDVINQLALDWDFLISTNSHGVAMTALKSVSDNFEELFFISRGHSAEKINRIPMVRLQGFENAVPLKSMGDGMLRVLQLIVKAVKAKNGFLLVDEFENGLHYSVQEKIWRHLFDLAEELNIQIFATTHSWDCIESFAKVAVEKTATEGVLFRVGRSVRTSDQGRVIATVFDEQKLFNITQSDVEVR